jgi:hypothetical protein
VQVFFQKSLKPFGIYEIGKANEDQDFEKCENSLDIYVVPYLTCYGKIQNITNEDGL